MEGASVSDSRLKICKGGNYCRPNEPRVYQEASEDVLQKYVGWFQMSDGSVLEIRREGAYLVAQGRPLGHRILIPKSNDEFHTYTPRKEWQPVVARFRSSAEGTDSVELSEGGKRLLSGRKLLPSGPATAQVRAGQDDSTKSAGENLSMPNQTAQPQLEDLYRRIDLAIVKRDRAGLEPLLDENFTFIHSGGGLDAGPIFLGRVAAGSAMVRQRTDDYAEFDVKLELLRR